MVQQVKDLVLSGQGWGRCWGAGLIPGVIGVAKKKKKKEPIIQEQVHLFKVTSIEGMKL